MFSYVFMACSQSAACLNLIPTEGPFLVQLLFLGFPWHIFSLRRDYLGLLPQYIALTQGLVAVLVITFCWTGKRFVLQGARYRCILQTDISHFSSKEF